MKDSKKENDSNDQRDPAYFGYYAQLTHQQNMLEDSVRTSIYNSTILMNSHMFENKLVCDIGAGSGILSYISVQAGAKKVYAVEASNMASRIKKLLKSCPKKNPWLTDKIEVISSKIEDPDLPIPKVDILVSEPIGVLLVHERMIESYLYARDHYLKPGGAMFPSSGTIYLAPFTDASLWTQTMAKVRFWEQKNFYGVDFSPLSQEAKDEIFGMPVVGTFDPKTIMSAPTSYNIDFYTVQIKELYNIYIPINWKASYTGLVHGIAGWFDINFIEPYKISTSPNSERTHWHQVRFLFKEPLAVNAEENISGWMKLIANDMRSYTIFAEVIIGDNMKLSNPEEVINKMEDDTLDKLKSRALNQGFYGRRHAKWDLQNQTYYYGYDSSVTTQQDYKSEYNCLYTPDNDMENDPQNISLLNTNDF